MKSEQQPQQKQQNKTIKKILPCISHLKNAILFITSSKNYSLLQTFLQEQRF